MAIGTGIKSALSAGKKALSESMTGKTLKNMAGRMGTSSFMKDTVSPALSAAWKGSGGGAGLGKRVLGGAAIGGATTGTISALRGNDFWEGARSGAVMGGMAGAGRHGYKMAQTDGAQVLGSAVSGEYSRARGDASRSFQASSLSKAASPSGNRMGVAPGMYQDMTKGYAGQGFWDTAKTDIKSTASAIRSQGRKTGASSRNTMSNNHSPRQARPRNMSNQAYTMTRGANEQRAAQNVTKRKV